MNPSNPHNKLNPQQPNPARSFLSSNFAPQLVSTVPQMVHLQNPINMNLHSSLQPNLNLNQQRYPIQSLPAQQPLQSLPQQYDPHVQSPTTLSTASLSTGLLGAHNIPKMCSTNTQTSPQYLLPKPTPLNPLLVSNQLHNQQLLQSQQNQFQLQQQQQQRQLNSSLHYANILAQQQPQHSQSILLSQQMPTLMQLKQFPQQQPQHQLQLQQYQIQQLSQQQQLLQTNRLLLQQQQQPHPNNLKQIHLRTDINKIDDDVIAPKHSPTKRKYQSTTTTATTTTKSNNHNNNHNSNTHPTRQPRQPRSPTSPAIRYTDDYDIIDDHQSTTTAPTTIYKKTRTALREHGGDLTSLDAPSNQSFDLENNDYFEHLIHCGANSKYISSNINVKPIIPIKRIKDENILTNLDPNRPSHHTLYCYTCHTACDNQERHVAMHEQYFQQVSQSNAAAPTPPNSITKPYSTTSDASRNVKICHICMVGSKSGNIVNHLNGYQHKVLIERRRAGILDPIETDWNLPGGLNNNSSTSIQNEISIHQQLQLQNQLKATDVEIRSEDPNVKPIIPLHLVTDEESLTLIRLAHKARAEKYKLWCSTCSILCDKPYHHLAMHEIYYQAPQDDPSVKRCHVCLVGSRSTSLTSHLKSYQHRIRTERVNVALLPKPPVILQQQPQQQQQLHPGFQSLPIPTKSNFFTQTTANLNLQSLYQSIEQVRQQPSPPQQTASKILTTNPATSTSTIQLSSQQATILTHIPSTQNQPSNIELQQFPTPSSANSTIQPQSSQLIINNNQSDITTRLTSMNPNVKPIVPIDSVSNDPTVMVVLLQTQVSKQNRHLYKHFCFTCHFPCTDPVHHRTMHETYFEQVSQQHLQQQQHEENEHNENESCSNDPTTITQPISDQVKLCHSCLLGVGRSGYAAHVVSPQHCLRIQLPQSQ